MAKIWFLLMFLSTVGLGVLGLLSKDNTVTPYVTMGVVALVFISLEGVVKAFFSLREINERRARLERARQQRMKREPASEEEKREDLMSKMIGTGEFAHRQSAQDNTAPRP